MDWEPTKASKAGAKEKKPNNGQFECYNCGEKGYIAKGCKNKAKTQSTKVSRAAQQEPIGSCKCQAAANRLTVDSNSDDSGKE
jgi:uncharacterized Fe-S center protein